MNYTDVVTATLRRPGRAKPNPLAGSVMNEPESPPPALNADLPIEPVSPEDWVPSPKSVAALLAKGGAALGAITSKEALQEARRYASLLKGKERAAVEHYTNTTSPWHAGEVNYALRKGLPIPDDAKEYINTLTEILRKAPKSDSTFEVYRGLPREAAFSGKRDPGFMSVSIEPGVADSYAEMIMDNAGKVHNDQGDMLGIGVGLLAPKGTPLVDPDVRNFWDDSELLLPRGSRIIHGNGDLAEIDLAKEFARPRFSSGNPGGDWLARQQQEVREAGINQFGVPSRFGSVTGSIQGGTPRLPVDLLATFKGQRGEQSNVRRDSLDWLMEYMGKNNKLPDSKDGSEYMPFIQVDANGVPWVNEGNHRIMAAKKLGWKDMPVQLQWHAGGELAPGPLNVDELIRRGLIDE